MQYIHPKALGEITDLTFSSLLRNMYPDVSFLSVDSAGVSVAWWLGTRAWNQINMESNDLSIIFLLNDLCPIIYTCKCNFPTV